MPAKTNNVQPQIEKKLLNLSPMEEQDNGKIKMKRHMGLLEGVAVILGIIFGSAFAALNFTEFFTVRNIHFTKGCNRRGWFSWVIIGYMGVVGLLSMVGAICYAELGTSIPKSGGDYAYINEAFGPLPSFLYLWAANIIFVPTTNAIMGLTFANYVIQPFFPQCTLPDSSIRLIAASVICKLIIRNYLNFMTEELQNPFVEESSHNDLTLDQPVLPSRNIIALSQNTVGNLPRAIYISLPLVTAIYVLANMAYLSVLTPDSMLASDAIAVTYGYTVLGKFAWILPIMVAISTFGGLSVHIMTASRMLYVGARNGHFPSMLAVLNVKRLTPAPCLAFLCTLSLFMLCTSDIHLLIQYSTIVESFFVTLSVLGLLYLRWKNPKMVRPIRVHVIVPLCFVIICLFLLVLPMLESPLLVLGALAITLTGVPFYYFGVVWKNKPEFFQNIMRKTTNFSQKFFVAAHEDKDEE
ncbi:hypothetical protein NQ317_012870 [Molorchus minor]|uniref:Amino acid transporter n=1 Tax=Molorchus minor TaxID=1323400 RepID=A0ABQ9J6H0_9CUCU|nr:hypothetical protein NQ317_012870 [Molorchus minor]